jgi:membrane protease YdiL (CAAX protease family)
VVAKQAPRRAQRAEGERSQLAVVIVSTLAVQAGVRWFPLLADALGLPVQLGGFFYGTFVLRTLVPLACAVLVLRAPLGELGLRAPRLQPGDARWLAAAALAVGLLAVPLLTLESYGAAYAPRSASYFLMFTLSTTLPWEWLHRGWLLFGARRVLAEGGLDARSAGAIALLFALVFEVLHHFPKPPLEALALFAGSPLLSWIALRTGSLAIPLAAHLAIEGLFYVLVLA